MNIVDLIPLGMENAISRYELFAKCEEHELCTSDRKMRRLIEKAREEHVILNNQDGNGYYRATADDYDNIKRHVKQERSRALSILKRMKHERAFCEDIERGRLSG